MTVSAYPATVDKILAVVNAAFPNVNAGADYVFIVQGVPIADTGAKRAVFVGVEANDQYSPPGKAGNGSMAWATMSTNHSRDERFGVNMIFKSASGNYDPSTRRDDAFALFGSVVTAITSDPSLSRAGGLLYVTDYGWTYSDTSDDYGTAGLIESTINFRARI